jgi:hypothetical protein
VFVLLPYGASNLFANVVVVVVVVVVCVVVI